MTQISIEDQLAALDKATKKNSRSKKAALKFLIEAGIIKEKKGQKVVKQKK